MGMVALVVVAVAGVVVMCFGGRLWRWRLRVGVGGMAPGGVDVDVGVGVGVRALGALGGVFGTARVG